MHIAYDKISLITSVNFSWTFYHIIHVYLVVPASNYQFLYMVDWSAVRSGNQRHI